MIGRGGWFYFDTSHGITIEGLTAVNCGNNNMTESKGNKAQTRHMMLVDPLE